MSGGGRRGWGRAGREVPDSALLKTGQDQELCVRLPLPFFLVSKVNWQPLVRVEMLSDAMIAARK